MDNSRNFVVITILCFTGILNGQYTTVPRNTARHRGQSLILDCAKDISVAGQVAWKEYISDPSGSVISIDGTVEEDYQNKYTVVNTGAGIFNLQVNSLSQNESGNHQCGIGVANERFAAVIMLTQPMCTASGTVVAGSTVAEGDDIALSCETTFTGRVAWAPVMNWTYNGNDLTARDESTGQIARYTASVPATRQMEGSQFSCVTYFTEPPAGLIPPDTTFKGYDKRAPIYNENCQTNSVIVHYGVENIQILAHIAELIPGDAVTCRAVGRPAPTYKWVRVEGGGTAGEILNEILIITADMKGNNTYRCEASNTLVGDRRMSINASTSFAVRIPTTTPAPSTTPSTAPPTTASSTSAPQSPGPISELSDQPLTAGAIAGISIAAILFVGILIALIIYFLCCKRQKKDPGTGMSSKAGVDQVRGPGYTGSSNPVPTDLAYVSGERPPPYTPAGDPRGRNPNQEGIVYADLALDDTPRSRKPIQFMDNTDYADIRRV